MSAGGLRCAAAALALAVVNAAACAQMPGQPLPELAPVKVEQSEHGFRASVGKEVVEVTVCRGSVIHVIASPDGPLTTEHPKPWMLAQKEACPGAAFRFAQEKDAATLTTDELRIEFSLTRGSLTFKTAAGDPLLYGGNAVPRTYEPTEAKGEKTYRITDRFGLQPMEAIYGLGQHQNGLFNYRGATVELAQNNTDVAIPLLLSTQGYGLLWNTAALSYVDNRFPLELKFEAIAGQSIDYYFIYGPELDRIIHLYRSMTGHTPMLPKWAYGYFQSKDRYVSLDQIKQIAGRYRAEHIPLDAMVQDWFWWKTEGDPEFNSNYHDVSADLKALHDEHVHAMISVWGLFDPKSVNYGIMTGDHWDVPDAHVYDATNGAARDFYWNNLAGKIFNLGWDAFWLDSAEPEEYWPHFGDAILRTKTLSIGNGAEYTNVFPLMHTTGVQEHWKNASQQKRVFLLTRSAFLGQQRVGAAVWSGDVYSTWWGLSHQVRAGLNFALSGYPYWTTDIGGYWPGYWTTQIADYQNLYARWFEFGTFCPVFRTHGHRPENELWSFKGVEPILIQYDKLRYRLMPYIYSLAWKVSIEDYTIQRPLVMDWRADAKTWDIGDEFMFGPALMVAPVLEQGAVGRKLYLPKAQGWYDFWTGDPIKGGGEIEAAAPLDVLPLYVRAGSILPMGPEIEYANQDSGGTVEIRIYRGADGSFDLYEDSGDSYDYEKGMHSIIPLRWNDSAGVLTIGARQGSFPELAARRQFRLVLVGPRHGVGEAVTSPAEREITYSGSEVRVVIAGGTK